MSKIQLLGEPEPDHVLHQRLAQLTQKHATLIVAEAQAVFDGLDVLMQAAAQKDVNADAALKQYRITLRKILEYET